jgi:hypothetical protein
VVCIEDLFVDLTHAVEFKEKGWVSTSKLVHIRVVMN